MKKLVKWCRLLVDGQAVYAIVDGDDALLTDVWPIADYKLTGRRIPLNAAVFLPPVEPKNFYAAGVNYLDHIQWANEHHGLQLKVPPQADVGDRMPSALTGSGSDVVLPIDSEGSFEFEGELVAVIGATTRNVSEEEALQNVAGYCLGNDLSERKWQFSDRTMWRAKNSDTFKPMGPFVVSGIDPMNQEISVRINGKTVSTYNTRKMIFGVAHYIARMSRYVTLHPGDVVWFGSDGPTVPGLKPGDLVEVVNDAMGILANRVVRQIA